MFWIYSVCLYINRKMRPVETIPGMGGGGIRRVMEGWNSTMIIVRSVTNVTIYPSITIILK
jgi:hypothetical protein